MEAEVRGLQRKVMSSWVRPARAALGDHGIPVRDGATLPFRVTREWTAPAGHYIEQWYLIDPQTKEVLYEGPDRELHIWGLQSLTEVVDEVTDRVPLAPGSYRIVFALDRVRGGELDVEAVEAPAEAA